VRVVALRLNHFRNLSGLDLSSLGRANVLVGKNAQGKTNILEAIFIAASGESFRMTQDRYLVQKGEVDAQVFMETVTDDEREKFVQLFWVVDGETVSKSVKLNALVVPRADLVKTIPVVIFSPEDIDLVRLSPSHRRKFLNLAIARHDAEYRQDLMEYTRIWRQRNQLLLLIKQGREAEEELDVWDNQLAEAGARIVRKRADFVSDIAREVGEHYKTFVPNGNGAELRLKYQPSIGLPNKNEYLEYLRRVRRLDIARVTTTHGIHRDDLMFILNDSDVRYTASRGEFRSAVLALKLAEGKYLHDKLGDRPVFLLDDAFSELDDDRKVALAEEIKRYQVFVTTNDANIATLFERPRTYEVIKGAVVGSVEETVKGD